MQREAHRRNATALAETDLIPQLPWTKSDLDPANIPADKERFYRRVDSNVVTKNIKGILSAKGWQDILLESSSFTFTDAS